MVCGSGCAACRWSPDRRTEPRRERDERSRSGPVARCRPHAPHPAEGTRRQDDHQAGRAARPRAADLPRRHRLGRRRRARPRDGDQAPAGVLRPARPGHQDRLRRGLHGRRLDHRPGHRPRPPAHAVRRAARQPRAEAAAEAARPGRRPAPPPRAQLDRGLARQHRAPLRPLQRPLRRVPRPVDDVLVGVVRRPDTRVAADRAGTQDGRHPRPGRRPRGHPDARDRQRLGRARRPRRAARRPRHHHHDLPGAGGARPASGSRRPGRTSSHGSTCSSSTTARCRAPTTRSSASR